ncbi:ABC transporter substrate-binding protein [Salinisphaera sp. SPP-AMP-43]|uniref:ABC transporter substrate-binding protein n=1 Tax=Salinisphaera sp. SPP-AMP-43 TaxID=3121288 RepID=UPI003C6E8CCD
MLDRFAAHHPDIELHYQDLSTPQVNRRVRNEDAPPDVVISSAMPAQMRLVNAGYAARLDSSASRDWPASAKWRNSVFGFSFEPVVFAYRSDRLTTETVPTSHDALFRLLNSQALALAGRIALYDPGQSEIGYALYQADAGYTARFWQLIASLGRAGAAPMANTRAMLAGLSSGRFDFAYNLIGSYARQWAATHPHIRVVVPTDYALVLRRLVFVHARAPDPNAAQIFVDYLLSPAGQRVLTTHTPLDGLPRAGSKPADGNFYPIPIDAGLMAAADPGRRQRFLERWRHEFDSAARNRGRRSTTEADNRPMPSAPKPR